jgi:UDP-glucose 4-epimerase
MMTLQGHVSDFAIFGEDYETPDGTAIRDYIHVVDLAAAHVRAVHALLDGSRGGHYNLGTGSGFSVREVLAAIERETDLKVPLVTKPRRAGDPSILVADPSPAQADLGFVPVCSDLSTTVRSSWAWRQLAHPKS